MVRPCPPTLALPSAFVSDVKWAGKIPNISLESSSQTAGTITEKAAAPGMEAYETHHTCVLPSGENCPWIFVERGVDLHQLRSAHSDIPPANYFLWLSGKHSGPGCES